MSKLSHPDKGGCPICGAAPVEKFRPFCSKHCADVDLGRWLSGSYAIPSVENDAEESLDEDEKMLP